MKKILLKKLLEYLPYFLVVFAIVLPWFYQSGYLFFTDFVAGPIMRLDWSSAVLIHDLFFYSLSFLLPVAFIQKLYITVVLLLVVFGGRKIASVLLPKKPVLVFIVSLFFLFNPFIYDRMGYGNTGVIIAFGLISFVFGYLLEYLEQKKVKQILFASIFTGLSILFSAQFVFFNAVFYILFLIIVAIKHKNYPWKKIIFCLLFSLIIILALNLNWLAGIFFASSDKANFLNSGITKQDFIAFQTAGKDAWQALSNVVLMGGFWGKDQFRYIDLATLTGNWGRSFIILLPIMIWGVIFAFQDKKRKGLIIGLLAIFMVATFLAIGIRTGIGEKVTFFLFDHLPFYKGMRETQKWVSLIVICYGIFLAWGLDIFFSKKLVKKNSILFAVIIIAVIVMQAPLMVWGMRGQFQPTNYPSDWQEINEFILHNPNNPTALTNPNPCASNILFLPWHTYMSFNFTGVVAANPASVFFACPVVSGTNMEWGGINDNSGTKEGILMEKWITTGGETDFLQKNELNIGYIILAKELDWRAYGWINKYTNQLGFIKETKNIILYKVINE
jgi:hypothetical protein